MAFPSRRKIHQGIRAQLYKGNDSNRSQWVNTLTLRAGSPPLGTACAEHHPGRLLAKYASPPTQSRPACHIRAQAAPALLLSGHNGGHSILPHIAAAYWSHCGRWLNPRRGARGRATFAAIKPGRCSGAPAARRAAPVRCPSGSHPTCSNGRGSLLETALPGSPPARAAA
jgi:hypothetical protein